MEVEEALLRRSSDNFRPSKVVLIAPPCKGRTSKVVLPDPPPWEFLTSKVEFALPLDDAFLTSKVAFPGDAFLTLKVEFGLRTSNVVFASSFRKVALNGESS
jgi:hypothetical protein